MPPASYNINRAHLPTSLVECHAALMLFSEQNKFLRDALEYAEGASSVGQEPQPSQLESVKLEVENYCREHSRRTVSTVALELMQPGALLREYHELRDALPTLHEFLKTAKWNQNDVKLTRLSGPARHAWETRIRLYMHRAMIDVLHARSQRLHFKLTIARSFALTHQHLPSASSDNLTREGLLLDSKTCIKARGVLKHWIPPTSFEISNDLILCSMDNLDMYEKKHTRLVDGELTKNTMIHAIVSERILFDRRTLTGAPPETDLLIRETEAVVKHAALPAQAACFDSLRNLWAKYTESVRTAVDIMQMFAKPAASEDRQTSGRTVCVSLPILTNRSTASKQDVAAAIRSLTDLFPHKRLAIVLDYQTFAVAWWLKARTPELYAHCIFIGCELHRQFHTDDCVYRLWWNYVLEPAAMWLFRKDIHQGFCADRYNDKEKFVRLVTVAGLKWLSLITDIPSDPFDLLERVKTNKPVWEFIGFLVFAGVYALADKDAMRTSNVPFLDAAWSWTSILARACGKTNYAKYGILMNLVMHSSHHWIRSLLDNWRTYRGSDTPCTGQGLGVSIEHSVRLHKSAAHIPSAHRLQAVNVGMTAQRETSRRYEDYLGVKPRKPAKQMVIAEDVQALVDALSLCFGTTWTALQEPQSWSAFAGVAVDPKQTGTHELHAVWPGLSAWVASMTTSCDGKVPLIFEPPEVEDPNNMDLDDMPLDSDEDLTADADDAADGEASDHSDWHRRAAVLWLRTHGGEGNPERLEQVTRIFQRAGRRRNLCEQRAAKQMEKDKKEEAEAIGAVADAETAEAVAAEIKWDVEGIVGKQVTDGVVRYRVKWAHYDSLHNTWEPVENLVGSEVLVAAFEEKFKTIKNPKVYAAQYTKTGRKRKKK